MAVVVGRQGASASAKQSKKLTNGRKPAFRERSLWCTVFGGSCEGDNTSSARAFRRSSSVKRAAANSNSIAAAACEINTTMSATMRTTLQTVPESLPADHITNSGAPVQCAAQMEPKSHSHSNSAGNKSIRSSTSRVSDHFIWLRVAFISKTPSPPVHYTLAAGNAC